MGFYRQGMIITLSALFLISLLVLNIFFTIDYWGGKSYYLIIIPLIIAALLFILIEDKTNLPIVIGSIMAFSAISFSKISEFAFRIFPSLQNIFLGKSHSVFWTFLTLGIVLVGAGIFLKIQSKSPDKKKIVK